MHPRDIINFVKYFYRDFAVVEKKSEPFHKVLNYHLQVFERLTFVMTSTFFVLLIILNVWADHTNGYALHAVLLQLAGALLLPGIIQLFLPRVKHFHIYCSFFYIILFLIAYYLPKTFGINPDETRESAFLLHMALLASQAMRPGRFPGILVVVFLALHAAVVAVFQFSGHWGFAELIRLFLFGWVGFLALLGEVVLYYNLIKYLELKNKQLQSQEELKLAKTVHANLFPDFKENDKFRIISYRSPENQTGGDFFDLVSLREGNAGFFLTDISGHGISSAMMSAAMKVILHQLPYDYRMHPEPLLTYIDSAISHDYSSHHASAVYIYLDFDNMIARIGNAGHPPILYSKKGGTFVELETRGTLLGFNLANPTAREISFPMCSGDRFLVYTDGLVELKTPQGIDQLHLMEYLNGSQQASSQDLINDIMQKIQKLPKFNGFHDDVMMVVLEIK